MKYSSLILWVVGIGLILFLCVLVEGLFQDRRILYLDGGVLISCYTLALFAYGRLFVSKEDFSNEVTATGVKIYTIWLYWLLAVGGIVTGLVYNVPFKWQLFFQLCFLFVVLIGLLFAQLSAERLVNVSNESMTRHEEKENLLMIAQQVQLAASMNTSITPDILSDLSKMLERVKFITPSSSTLAKQQENILRQSLGKLHELINANIAGEQLGQEIEKTKQIIAQRLKIY